MRLVAVKMGSGCFKISVSELELSECLGGLELVKGE